jgi:methylmalonyl-CoA/ethylmalonyl-CoA epimerase
MDRPVTLDLRARLADGGPGGVIAAADAPSAATIREAATATGATLVTLDGPASKGALLDALQALLVLPGWMGRNWDALHEVLAYPEPPPTGPVVVLWHHPERLPDRDRAAFADVVRSVAAIRSAAGDAAIIVVEAPPGDRKEAGMSAVPSRIRSLGKVHHVALIVGSIETALGFWRDTLGAPLEAVMDIEHDRVRIAFLTVGESKVELVQPTDDTTGVARFLASKGEGFHHVCFEVDDLAATLTRLEIDGLELIDTAPRRGAEGPVAFIHPRSCHGVLVELIEAPGGPAWGALGF